jgi:hypothetical protein
LPAFSYQDGFHRADWDFVRRWIESHIRPEDLDGAWNEAALIWVSKLREDLDGGYRILQSRQSVLLCDRPLAIARWLLDYAGRTALTIKEHLGDAAWQGGFGKDVILVFSDADDYYEYLAYHTPDGEQPASGGVCIHSGYTHIAVPWRDELDAANTIVHELTHNCLAHLPLPLWLNEGVAVTLQKSIAPPGISRISGFSATGRCRSDRGDGSPGHRPRRDCRNLSWPGQLAPPEEGDGQVLGGGWLAETPGGRGR